MKVTKVVDPISENVDCLLYNVNNYKPQIQNTDHEILTKFVSVITEYIQFIAERINMKNKIHYKFILERGLETIIHVFSIILIYTKNLNLATYHCQKAYYFYIEFIEQISDDNVTFLQLSSRDAILFVYKKTIYDINHEYIKNMAETSVVEKNLLVLLDIHIQIYKKLILYLINHIDLKNDNRKEFMKIACDNIKTMNSILNKHKLKKAQTQCVFVFIKSLINNNIQMTNIIQIIDEFIKRLNKKKNIDESAITAKIYELDNESKIDDTIIEKISDLLG